MNRLGNCGPFFTGRLGCARADEASSTSRGLGHRAVLGGLAFWARFVGDISVPPSAWTAAPHCSGWHHGLMATACSVPLEDQGSGVLPAKLRAGQRWAPGTALLFVEAGGGVMVTTIGQARGTLRCQLEGSDVVASLLEEQRAAAVVEDGPRQSWMSRPMRGTFAVSQVLIWSRRMWRVHSTRYHAPADCYVRNLNARPNAEWKAGHRQSFQATRRIPISAHYRDRLGFFESNLREQLREVV